MIPRAVEIRRAAENDLSGHYVWLAREADEDIAESMLANADKAWQALAEAPGMGALVDTEEPELRGMRKWRIRRFPDLLVFYRYNETNLFIERVLHAAQNWLTELERG